MEPVQPVRIETPEGRTTFGPIRRAGPSGGGAVRRVDAVCDSAVVGQSLSPDPTGLGYSFSASAKYWV